MVDRDLGLVTLSIDSAVATIRLNRPSHLNAFTEASHEELRAILSLIESDSSVRAVILSGTGRGFCSGQDLAERASAFANGITPDLGLSLGVNYNPLIQRIATLPCPVIAAVNGVASGAGAALAIACDLIVAGESARFQFGFVRVALGPDSGTSWLLPRRVGEGRALALALTGEALDARQALAQGLCDLVVADDELQAEARYLARQIVEGPVEATRTIKRLMRIAPPTGLTAALAAEQQAQSSLGGTENYREAVTAFAARRAPIFS